MEKECRASGSRTVMNGSKTPGLAPRLSFVQGNAGAHPGFIDVEIDAHHFALTHSHKVVDQRGFRSLSGQTNIIRISAFDFWPSTVTTNGA